MSRKFLELAWDLVGDGWHCWIAHQDHDVAGFVHSARKVRVTFRTMASPGFFVYPDGSSVLFLRGSDPMEDLKRFHVPANNRHSLEIAVSELNELMASRIAAKYPDRKEYRHLDSMTGIFRLGRLEEMVTDLGMRIAAIEASRKA